MKLQHDFAQIGSHLWSTPLPWIRIGVRMSGLYGFLDERRSAWKPLTGEIRSLLSRDLDSVFGAFGLMAAMAEIDAELGEIVESLKERIAIGLSPVAPILLARFGGMDYGLVQQSLDECGFRPEQQNFIWRWIRHEFDLVNTKKDRELRERAD